MNKAPYQNLDFPPSLWGATATPASVTPPLDGNQQTDVAIVGGGFTGLSSALHLAEQGSEVVVLEAGEPGWGASGRNGGQVIPGLKEDPSEILLRFGPELGEKIIKSAGQAADLVFNLIRRYEMDCEFQQNGWIQAAHTKRMLPTLRRRYDDWAARDANVAWIDRDELAQRMGDDRYHGGWIDKRGGGVQPLSYARGLAKTAQMRGARVHGASPVTSLNRRRTGWHLTTPSGVLTANKVILATNGYTDYLWPGLAKSIIPLYSAQVATAPLGENFRSKILGGGEVLSDTHRVLWYFRKDHHGRLIMGGGGSAYENGVVKVYDSLKDRARTLFPEAGDIEFEYSWNGKVAVTTDHYPHLHELAPNLYAGLGYNGRGVAMATMMGRILADRILGTEDPEFEFATTPLHSLPLHGLRGIAVTAARAYYRFRDTLDD